VWRALTELDAGRAGPLSCPNTETTTRQAIKLDAASTLQDREGSGPASARIV
jgi:hypothetical protein